MWVFKPDNIFEKTPTYLAYLIWITKRCCSVLIFVNLKVSFEAAFTFADPLAYITLKYVHIYIARTVIRGSFSMDLQMSFDPRKGNVTTCAHRNTALWFVFLIVTFFLKSVLILAWIIPASSILSLHSTILLTFQYIGIIFIFHPKFRWSAIKINSSILLYFISIWQIYGKLFH